HEAWPASGSPPAPPWPPQTLLTSGSCQLRRVCSKPSCVSGAPSTQSSHDLSRCNEVIMNAKTIPLLALALSVATVAVASDPPPGATITVNSTADAVANDNACTLREAIRAATKNVASTDTTNGCAAGVAAPARDIIAFNIPDSDPGCIGTAPKKIC